MRTAHIGETSVYRLYDQADRLLYVGVASIPESRWRDHSSDKAWWPDVARKTVNWHPTYAGALTEEAHAILAEEPIHNVRRDCKPPDVKAAPAERHVPVRVARENIGAFIDAAFYTGEPTIITKNGEPRAVLLPQTEVARLRKVEQGLHDLLADLTEMNESGTLKAEYLVGPIRTILGKE